MSLNKVQGWYADTVTGPSGTEMWQPCLQSEFAGITELDITFDDRDTCEWFIRHHLVGQGWLDGPRRYECPDCLALSGTWCVNLVDGTRRLTYHSERLRFMHGGWPLGPSGEPADDVS